MPVGATALPRVETSENADEVDIILEHVGSFGNYQKVLFACTLPIGVCFAFVYFVQMFIAATPQRHWCWVPELAHLDKDTRHNLVTPKDSKHFEWDQCHTFDVDWNEVLKTMKPPDPKTPKVMCQHGWEFDFVDIPYETVVSERDWVCHNAGKVPLAQTIFFVGSFAGGVLFGWMADRHGRLPVLVGSNMIACIGGIATIFTTAFWDFVFCRFLVGMAYDIQFTIIYILVLEYVGRRQRTYVGNAAIMFFGSGCIILPWLALWMADWRKLLWLTSTPLLCVLAMPFFVPESARWLITRGRLNDSLLLFRRFEKLNRKKIPQQALDNFINKYSRPQTNDETIMDLWHTSPPLKWALLLMVFVYMTCALVFDGLVRMSENLGMDFFITFTLTSATEIPAVLVLTVVLDRMGRRLVVGGSLVVGGILIIIGIFVPTGLPVTALAITARFFISMAYNSLNQWATEMLPTSVRALATSIIHIIGYISTTLSPVIVFSGNLWLSLPLVILGVVAVVSGSTAFLMPETKNLDLPQTIAAAEIIVINHSYFYKSPARA